METYPRRWILEDETDDPTMVAEIDIDEVNVGKKVLRWPLGYLPDLDQLNWIRAQLTRLRDLDDIVARSLAKLSSDHERKIISEYFLGYKEALELAIAFREGRNANYVDERASYDELIEAKGIGVEGSNTEVCLHNPNKRNHHSSDTTTSQYQSIRFTYNEELDNTCLELSGWLQTCTNFRPVSFKNLVL